MHSTLSRADSSNLDKDQALQHLKGCGVNTFGVAVGKNAEGMAAVVAHLKAFTSGYACLYVCV
jgi:hypothetical protein